GAVLAYAGPGPVLGLCDAATGEQLWPAGREAGISGIAYAPGGRELVSAMDDGSYRTWSLTDGGELRHRKLPHWLSADEKTLAASGYGDRPLRFWDVPSGEELPKLLKGVAAERIPGPPKPDPKRKGRELLRGVDPEVLFLPDGKTIALAGDGVVYLH